MKCKKFLSVVLSSVMVAGCAACSGTQETDKTNQPPKDSPYQVTEENENLEMTMNNQPEASYWFPKQLLEWEAKKDPDLEWNKSIVPLAERVDRNKLQAVNETQNKDTNIMAISIMNSSTSGNAPRGLNKSDCNTFTYWQYVDTLVYWGGSSGEGLIVAPSPDVVDAGHKNGVKVIGTIFFPQSDHGGKLEWLDDFLQKDVSGGFPMADKLAEVARTYGFDGWFFNQETEGTQEEPFTAEQSALVREFIQDFKEKAPELQMIYYDSMTTEGNIDWQNALNEKNLPFMKNESGENVADSMFLNFWWTEEELASLELLKASAQKAEENQLDPYSLYAGVDIQSEGYLTPIQWNLFEKSKNSTYTSLGLYCPSWTYSSSAGSMDDFWAKENLVWVNSKGDPSAKAETSSDTGWKGISAYAVERTAITSLPFITNFNVGNGYSFYKNGEQISKLDWNNRSISDIMPTYRYLIENGEGNKLSASVDVANVYYGGSSLKLRGDMVKGTGSAIKLYSTDFEMTKGAVFTTVAKATADTELSAVVTLEDGSEQVLKGDKKAGQDWTTVAFDTSSIEGQRVRGISYQLATAEDASGYEFHFGNITIGGKDNQPDLAVSDVTVEDKEFDEDALYAGVRLTWKADQPAEYYEVYRINENKTKSLLGVTNTTNFFINALPRTDETNKSTFEVLPVSKYLEDGTSAEVTMDWPDNSIPKAGFQADKTLVVPGETVTFKSACSENTKTIKWKFEGAETETAEGETATAVYQKEGVYNVTLTAENDSGKTEKSVEGCIVVSGKASGGLKVLSQGAATEASSFVNDNEAPQFAVDGDQTKKWCATGTPPHELIIDLGAVKTVCAVDISHAEEGGESADMNTKAYTIMISEDGSEYQEAVNITRNTAGLSHDTFAPEKARYVKLLINKPSQGSDTAARIYEVEVYGINDVINEMSRN